MNINKNKTYQDKKGNKVIIYNVTDQEVHGAIILPSGIMARTWKLDGQFYLHEESENDLVEVSQELEMDEKIIVWNHPQVRYFRHFAGVDQYGNLMAWEEGKTSFTTHKRNIWRYYEKY